MISASMDSPPKERVPHYGLVATAIRRYWGEAVVVAIALLVWLPRLSGPIDLRWDGGVSYLSRYSLARVMATGFRATRVS